MTNNQIKAPKLLRVLSAIVTVVLSFLLTLALVMLLLWFLPQTQGTTGLMAIVFAIAILVFCITFTIKLTKYQMRRMQNSPTWAHLVMITVGIGLILVLNPQPFVFVETS